jgi:hypothetical protein
MPAPTSESWQSRGTCPSTNRDGIPCRRDTHVGGIHCGTEAGGGSVSWTDDEPAGLPITEAAAWLLSHPATLLDLCNGDVAAVRGARLVLALVTREELGQTVARLSATPGKDR